MNTNKKSRLPRFSARCLIVIALVLLAVLAGCDEGKETPERVTPRPTPRVTPRPTIPPVSSPVPPSVPAATRTPVAATPAPSPTSRPSPAFFTLNLRVKNPGYGSITVDPYSPTNVYPKDSKVTIVARPEPGRIFGGWRGDAGSAGDSVTVTMDRDKAISGDFSVLSYTVDLVPVRDGGTIAVSPIQKSYEYGWKVTAEAKPAPGYVFDSWIGDISGSQNPATVVVENNKKIGATFVKSQFTLTTKVNPSGFVEVSPPVGRVDGGTRVTLKAIPSPNYRFLSWSGGASGSSPTVTITMDANKEVIANFIRLYSLYTFVDPVGTGVVSPASGTYDDGAEVTLTAVPVSGYEFVGWSGMSGDIGSNLVTRIVMNWDKSISATFRVSPRVWAP